MVTALHSLKAGEDGSGTKMTPGAANEKFSPSPNLGGVSILVQKCRKKFLQSPISKPLCAHAQMFSNLPPKIISLSSILLSLKYGKRL